jgi:hypothetical protein
VNSKRFAFTATLALGLTLFTPVHVHRRDFDVAFQRWNRDPVPTNASTLSRESEKNYLAALSIELAVACILFAVLNTPWLI